MSKITQGERCQAQFLLDHLNAQASAYPHRRCTAAYRAAWSQSRGVLLPCPDCHAYSGWLGDALQRVHWHLHGIYRARIRRHGDFPGIVSFGQHGTKLCLV
jgi:hypothetical protein